MSMLLRNPRGRAGLFIFVFIVLVALIGPAYSPPASQRLDLGQALLGPSADHLLGTDQLGRDFLARVALGLRTSLVIALVSTLIGMILGISSGLFAGYFRGFWEPTFLRFVDIILAVPNLVLALVIAALMGAGTIAVIITLIARAFPVYARIAHATTRKSITLEFIESTIVLGASPFRIIFHHLMPNVMVPSISLFPIMLGGGILIAASLSFFGLGVQPPESELGLLVAEGRRYMHLLPMLLWVPGIVLLVNNISLSLLGDGFREVLDPAQREKAG